MREAMRAGSSEGLRLDLGSGPNPRAGYVGVDRRGSERVIAWDFTRADPWPFESGSVDALYSSHLIEHLPALNFAGRDVLAWFFEEAWRVCKDGAPFELRWPVPFHPDTGAVITSAWWDPTHYRHIPEQQLWCYFSSEGRRAMRVESYGIACNWVQKRAMGYRTLHEEPLVLEYDAELVRKPL
jgi:hypothetical protein